MIPSTPRAIPFDGKSQALLLGEVLDSLPDGDGVVKSAADVVDALFWLLRVPKNRVRHVRRVDIVSHLVALMAVNGVGHVPDGAFDEIAEESLHLDCRS